MVAVVGFGGKLGGADLVVELCGGAVLRGGRGGGRGRLGSEHICYKFRSKVTVGTYHRPRRVVLVRELRLLGVFISNVFLLPPALPFSRHRPKGGEKCCVS